MSQMDIDDKLAKSLDELIKTSRASSTSKRKDLTRKKRDPGRRSDPAKMSAITQPASAQSASAQVRRHGCPPPTLLPPPSIASFPSSIRHDLVGMHLLCPV